MVRKRFTAMILGAALAASASGAPANGYSIGRVSLPGQGRGDYLTVDTTARRLYVTHSAVVHVLELDTLRPIATIGTFKAIHGVALDPPSGHGFITDGDQNAVIMFDLRTSRPLKTIAVGKKPDCILGDAASGMVFAFDGDSEEVSVIDPRSGTVSRRIKLPNGPEFAQTDNRGRVWVNMADGNAIAEIDTRRMKVVRTIPLARCDGPAALAFDPLNRVLFSGCGNHVMAVTDADSGQVITTVPIGNGPDGIAFDPVRKRLFVANRDGNWDIIAQRSRSRYEAVQTLKIDAYAKTVALDPGSHRVFTSTADLVWLPPVPGKKHLPTAKPGSFRLLAVSEK